MEPRRAYAQAVHHPRNRRRTARRRRHTSRPRPPHWPLRTLINGQSCRQRVRPPQRPTLRNLLLRPMRRTHPRHHRHDGLPPIPQRRRASLPSPSPISTDRPRRHGHRILRQRTPRNDDGHRRAPRKTCRHCPRWRNPSSKIRRRCRHDPIHRRPIRTRRSHTRIRPRCRMQSLRIPRRRLPVPRNRRHITSRLRSTRTRHHTRRTLSQRYTRVVRCRRPICPCTRHGRKPWHQIQRHPRRHRVRKRNGRPRRMWWLYQSLTAHTSHRPRRWTLPHERRRLATHKRRRSPHRRCPTQRTHRTPDRAALRRRRRPRGDAPPAQSRSPRHLGPYRHRTIPRRKPRLVGRLRAPSRHAQLPPKRRRCRPRQRHNVCRPRQIQRPHQYRHIPWRKPRTARLRHQVHRHRPNSRRRRRCLPQHRQSSRFHLRTRRYRSNQDPRRGLQDKSR